MGRPPIVINLMLPLPYIFTNSKRAKEPLRKEWEIKNKAVRKHQKEPKNKS
jgi:hypothetical protein